jgi:DNA helicase-2/ATP-dependent DNA helicase PcrA
VTIAPQILREFPGLNEQQKGIVGHLEGPLLVIAGPGSGKTFSLVLRTINLLLLGRAKPSEILLCTFTEKAAYELQDRVASSARAVKYGGDLSELRVGTIHGICNRFVQEYRHRTQLGSGYEVLDDLTQLLFIFEQFIDIVGRDATIPFLGRWNSKWPAIEGLRDYFNKITEELVSPDDLVGSGDGFLSGLGAA